jgi:hypothetical protein
MKMVIDGDASAEQAFDAWETIIRRNSRLNGTAEFDSYLSELKGYAQYLADFNTIKAMLHRLLYVIDNEYIEYLKSRGYYINTTGARAYEESVYRCIQQSENIKSKIKSKVKLLEKRNAEAGPATSFEEIMASLCAALGFHVPDDLKLARYNQYLKLLKDRNKPNPKAHEYDK